MITKEILNDQFWSLPSENVAKILETHTQNGITEEQAKERLKIFGENVMEKIHITPALLIFLNQFKSPLILMLLFAVVVTIAIGHTRDALFILAAVVVNTALGFYQEFKAEKALSELKTYLKQRSRVIRNGRTYEIDAINLVPGDLIRLSQGDRVPADGRIVFINDVLVDEAILTGESLPTTKLSEPVDRKAVLGDQQSMVFAGTLLTQGDATVMICRTGFSTELGKIAELVSESRREETPLQGAIRRFSVKAGIFLSILTLIVFIVGISFGYSQVEMFLMSVAIAVSAVPEGLPVAMTVILATGVQRMARRKGVVRKLVAAEALGSTTVILTDKTGTLTMAKMELSKLLPIKATEEKTLLEKALINTNVIVENPTDKPQDWRMIGKTIETSLVQSAAMRGISVDGIKGTNEVLKTLPFNAVNKYSVSLIRTEGLHQLVLFGAADILIEHSTLGDLEKKEILESIHVLARSGELVVGVATKNVQHSEELETLKDVNIENLFFEGLMTLRDPIRPNVKEAIKSVHEAGIRTIVMTGDHQGTAESVAKEVGIHVTADSIINATELRRMSDEELKERLSTLSIVARVSPVDKMRIVKAFQEMGEVVAMTGDGVNDAPSVKKADIGIAMGSGTEVTRDVADLVLLDDNFETIAAAVEEGRQIMNNIRKVLVYLLSSVLDGLILIGGSLALGLALPLNALQILWVNFFSDSFPAIAFAFERDGGGSIVRHKGNKTVLFNPLMKYLILFIGISTSILLFALYWLMLRAGYSHELASTFIFASFGSYSLFLAFSVRSLDKSIFEYPLFSNIYLVAGVAIGIILMAAAIYVPFLQTIFGTVSLPFYWVVAVIAVGVFNIALIEMGKVMFRFKRKFAGK